MKRRNNVLYPSFNEPHAKVQRYDRLATSESLDVIKVHIIQAKLDSHAIPELFSLVENHGGPVHSHARERRASLLNLELCGDVCQADVVVTALRMRKRFERHVDWNIAKEKAIVTPKWLLDSAKNGKPMPCGDYVALSDLADSTRHNCSDDDSNVNSESDAGSSSPTAIPGGPAPSSVDEVSSSTLLYTSRYACSRASPLICPNQGLVSQFSTIRRSRELEGEERSALSYERAIAALKAYPYAITQRNVYKEVAKLPYVGPKVLSMIEEYLSSGSIKEYQIIFNSSRFQSLFAFNSVYGIGPTTARRLHALGLRTIQDLGRYYQTEDIEILKQMESQQSEQDEHLSTDLSIKVALALKSDLDKTIPREEVQEMHRVIMHELDHIQKGCESTIVGGYRRGKLESNDVDIVITHRDAKLGTDRVKRMCKDLLKRLSERGIVTYVMRNPVFCPAPPPTRLTVSRTPDLSGFHQHNALRTHHRDALETALTVFILPPDGIHRRLHRRLDLIFAAPEVYPTAIVGWTGSKMFERDLRSWAKQKGLKFDSSGITRRRDSNRFFPKSEKEVFEILGLEWVDPTSRNADA